MQPAAPDPYLRTKLVVIDDDGRDKGQHYLVTEMPAGPAEKWALRVLQGLIRSNVDIPPELMGAGWMGLVFVSVKAFGGMEWGVAEPLLDEMMACVRIVRDPAHPAETTFPLLEGDIKEVATRVRLRFEVWNLHQSFSLPAALSSYQGAAGGTAPNPQGTPTSPPA